MLRGVYRSPSWPVDELSAMRGCMPRPTLRERSRGRPPAVIWGFRRLPSRPADPRARATGAQAVDAHVGRPYRTAAIREDDVIAARRRHPDHESGSDRARSRPVRAARRPAVRSSSRRCTTATSPRLTMAAVAVDFVSPQAAVARRRTSASSTGGRRGAPAESHPEVRVMPRARRGRRAQDSFDSYPISCPATATLDSTSPCRRCGGRSKSTFIPTPRRDGWR